MHFYYKPTNSKPHIMVGITRYTAYIVVNINTKKYAYVEKPEIPDLRIMNLSLTSKLTSDHTVAYNSKSNLRDIPRYDY